MATREDRLLETVGTLADSMVDEFDVVELLQLLVDESAKIFDAVAAGILLVGPEGELEVLASTSESSALISLMQLRYGQGPCVEAVTTGRVVSIADLNAAADRWPLFANYARRSGFASVHATPMRMRESIIGSLNLFRDRVGDLNDPDAAAARTLADIATISILQHRLTEESRIARDQLQRALDNRVVIEQAKGYVAQSRNLDMDEAFQLIRAHARSTRTALSTVAADITAGRVSL